MLSSAVRVSCGAVCENLTQDDARSSQCANPTVARNEITSLRPSHPSIICAAPKPYCVRSYDQDRFN